MLADYAPRPFGFASEELLTNVLGAEINAVTQLLVKNPNLPDLFDAPETTIPQRTACFLLLAHRKLMEMIYETFTGRDLESPSLGDEESNALKRTNNLVASDAPGWVLEMNEVVELLPFRIYETLPDPLRRGGFDPNNAAEVEAMTSAAQTLSGNEQIQALIREVLDKQLQRLERRWPAVVEQVQGPNVVIVQAREPNAVIVQARQRNKRQGWEQRLKLYAAIQNILRANPELQGMEFCAQLDTRHAPPLWDWTKNGEWREGLTWKEAWRIPKLRAKIRRVRQEAMKDLKGKSR